MNPEAVWKKGNRWAPGVVIRAQQAGHRNGRVTCVSGAEERGVLARVAGDRGEDCANDEGQVDG